MKKETEDKYVLLAVLLQKKYITKSNIMFSNYEDVERVTYISDAILRL